MSEHDKPVARSSKKPPNQDEFAAMKEKCDEYLAGWQRAQADYQNLQKETQKRVAENIKFATEEFLQELLPMVDHFKYGLKGIPEEDRNSSWVKGLEYIQQNFMNILEAHGVTTIPTVGKPFNIELHESVEEVEAEGKSGTIAEEVATGFMLNGKVIRCAKVHVIK